MVTDENEPKESNLKLMETINLKSNFSQIVFADTPKPLTGVPSDTLALQCPLPCRNISLKSLPPLGVRDSLENILRIRRHGEFPRRNSLRSFVRANCLERRPRRRLCHNKTDGVAGSNETDLLKSETRPEVNVKKLRCQLVNEKKAFNRYFVARFGQNMRNRIRGEVPRGQFASSLNQGLSYEVVISLCKDEGIDLQIASSNSKALKSSCSTDIKPVVHGSKLRARKASELPNTPNKFYTGMDMLCAFKKLSLNTPKREWRVRPELPETSQQTANVKAPVDLQFRKNNLSMWLKDSSVNDRTDRTNSQKGNSDESELEFQELNEMGCKNVNSPQMGIVTDNNFIDLQSCPSRVDFSSGDDTQNLGSKLSFDEAENVCKMTRIEKRRKEDYESRRSVQWNSEVDVIYYAGDTDGGKVVSRKTEPLRKEADQQARRHGFIKVALNKNLISAFNAYEFQNPWLTVYHK